MHPHPSGRSGRASCRAGRPAAPVFGPFMIQTMSASSSCVSMVRSSPFVPGAQITVLGMGEEDCGRVQGQKHRRGYRLIETMGPRNQACPAPMT
jgi:hypothetical protein